MAGDHLLILVRLFLQKTEATILFSVQAGVMENGETGIMGISVT